MRAIRTGPVSAAGSQNSVHAVRDAMPTCAASRATARRTLVIGTSLGSCPALDDNVRRLRTIA